MRNATRAQDFKKLDNFIANCLPRNSDKCLIAGDVTITNISQSSKKSGDGGKNPPSPSS